MRTRQAKKICHRYIRQVSGTAMCLPWPKCVLHQAVQTWYVSRYRKLHRH